MSSLEGPNNNSSKTSEGHLKNKKGKQSRITKGAQKKAPAPSKPAPKGFNPLAPQKGKFSPLVLEATPRIPARGPHKISRPDPRFSPIVEPNTEPAAPRFTPHSTRAPGNFNPLAEATPAPAPLRPDRRRILAEQGARARHLKDKAEHLHARAGYDAVVKKGSSTAPAVDTPDTDVLEPVAIKKTWQEVQPKITEEPKWSPFPEDAGKDKPGKPKAVKQARRILSAEEHAKREANQQKARITNLDYVPDYTNVGELENRLAATKKASKKINSPAANLQQVGRAAKAIGGNKEAKRQYLKHDDAQEELANIQRAEEVSVEMARALESYREASDKEAFFASLIAKRAELEAAVARTGTRGSRFVPGGEAFHTHAKRQLSALSREIAVIERARFEEKDRIENPLKWATVDQMDSRVKPFMRPHSENVTDQAFHDIEIFDYEKISNANKNLVSRTTNGFLLQLENKKEVINEEGNIVTRHENARYSIIGPDGKPFASGLSHTEAMRMMVAQAEAFQSTVSVPASGTPSSPEVKVPSPEFQKYKSVFELEHGKDGLGSIIDHIEKNVPGFERLSDGQKLLTTQSILDRMYQEVKEVSRSNLNERLTSNTVFGKTFEGKKFRNPLVKVNQYGEKRWFFQKEKEKKDIHGNVIEQEWDSANITINPVVAAGRALNSSRKKYLAATYEKKAFEKLLSPEDRDAFITMHGAQLASIIQDSGLEATLGEDGKTIIGNYAGTPPLNASPEYLQIHSAYNLAASAFARIPYEWRTQDATSAQKDMFRDAYDAYVAAEAAYISELQKSGGSMGVLTEIDIARMKSKNNGFIESMQWLAANPDAGEQLRKIGSQKAWVRGMLDAGTERALISGASGGIKAGLTFTGLGMLALPVAAGAIAAYRGYGRAKDSLVEKNRLNRAGERQAGATAIGMGNVERHIKRLRDYERMIMRELGAPGGSDEAKLKQYAHELKLRTDFMMAKYDLGHINFGPEKKEDAAGYNKLQKKIEFTQRLHSAQIMLQTILSKDEIVKNYEEAVDFSDGSGVSKGHKMGELLGRIGERNEQKVAAARKAYVVRQALTSAGLGAFLSYGSEQVVGHFFGPGHSAEANAAPAAATTGAAQYHSWDGDINKAGATTETSTGEAPAVTLPRSGDTTTAFTQSRDTTAALQSVENPAPSTNGTTVTNTGLSAGTNTGVEAPVKITPENSVAEVSVKKGGGSIDLIKDFKHSKEFSTLPAGVQKFFNRDEVSIAKDLKDLSADGKSENIGLGSKFGVTKDGQIYRENTLYPGKPQILGKVSEDGTFTEGSAKHTYLENAGKTIEKNSTESLPPVPKGELPPVPHESPVYASSPSGEVGTEQLPAVPGSVQAETPSVPDRMIGPREDTDDIYYRTERQGPKVQHEDDIYGKSTKAHSSERAEDDVYGKQTKSRIEHRDPTKLTHRERVFIRRTTEDRTQIALNKHFGNGSVNDYHSHSYKDSNLWKAIRKAPAGWMTDKYVPSNLKNFVEELKQVAGGELPEPENRTVEEYIEYVYEQSTKASVIESHLTKQPAAVE